MLFRSNAGNKGFKRADVMEVLAQSLPGGLTRSQKLDSVSNMLRALHDDGLLAKTNNGKGWLITEKGEKEL